VSEVYGTIEGNTFKDKIEACKYISLFLCCFFFRNSANAPEKQTNFTRKVICCYFCHFTGLELLYVPQLSEIVEGLRS